MSGLSWASIMDVLISTLFLGFTFKPVSWMAARTWWRCLKCSSHVQLKLKMSSIYATQKDQ